VRLHVCYGRRVGSIWLDDVIPLHLATVTFPDAHPLAGETGEVFGFAIRHHEGVTLFDTGVGVGNDYIDRAYSPVRHALAAALATHEIGLDDVTAIANSHLHFDHCGNNPLFPGVPIYAQERELEAAREPWYTAPEWVDFPGAEYRSIEGDIEVSDSMHIVATPGHTSGHQSIVLDTPAGIVVLAGQAVYTRKEYEELCRDYDAATPVEAQLYVDSARRLIALRPVRVHFSHDRDVWHRPDHEH
jgi:N-acyl homoserine lactone hydrolase